MIKSAQTLGLENTVAEFYEYVKQNPKSVVDFAREVGLSHGCMNRLLNGNEPRNLKVYLALRKFLDTKNNEKLSSQS